MVAEATMIAAESDEEDENEDENFGAICCGIDEAPPYTSNLGSPRLGPQGINTKAHIAARLMLNSHSVPAAAARPDGCCPSIRTRILAPATASLALPTASSKQLTSRPQLTRRPRETYDTSTNPPRPPPTVTHYKRRARSGSATITGRPRLAATDQRHVV